MLKKRILALCVLAVLSALGLAVWYWSAGVQTYSQIEAEWLATPVNPITDLGTTRTLEILPIFEEASSNPALEAEHGVSYLVRTDHANILVDAGMTPTRFSHNLAALGLDANAFDILLITHAHPDHLGGWDAWLNNTISPGSPSLDLTGKQVLVPVPLQVPGTQGIVVKQPRKLAPGVASIGTIAFPELFPMSLRSMRNGEQALVVNVQGRGMVLITGCGHPTVERLVARTRQLFSEPIAGIVGGLHYDGMTLDAVRPHIAFIGSLNPQLVAVSPHDSGAEAIQAFRAAFPSAYQPVEVGKPIAFEKGKPQTDLIR